MKCPTKFQFDQINLGSLNVALNTDFCNNHCDLLHEDFSRYHNYFKRSVSLSLHIWSNCHIITCFVFWRRPSHSSVLSEASNTDISHPLDLLTKPSYHIVRICDFNEHTWVFFHCKDHNQEPLDADMFHHWLILLEQETWDKPQF